jgi:predicted nucleic acid-binding protein
MIVISDTTPLRYLIEIEEVHILEKLFGQVIIPEKVFDELQGKKTPEKVKAWIQSRPAWLEVRKADISLFTPAIKIQDGERQAIALAIELKADILLLDDDDALKEARRLKLTTSRLFAIFERAAEQGFLDLPEAIDKMRRTSFHIPPAKLIEEMLERDQKRKEAEEKARKKTKKQKQKRTRKR